MWFPFFRDQGVLGLNARNLLYVKPFNPKKAVAFADDKMKTKAFLSARGIPTAKLFARIENRRQLKQFDFSSLPDECVLKPNYGFGGEGIIILRGRHHGTFLEQGKLPIQQERLVEHIEDILDGKFSVNGKTDTAFFEQILETHPSLLALRPAGLPDIRIIVFNLVPVMAMLRIPTAESGGKANLHLGGIGMGIDIAKGTTTYGAQYHGMISVLPHGLSVSGFEIPYWKEMLQIAANIQYITNIGYLAVDLTLDKNLGPVLLEVNARAGLTVQTANLAPLRARLKRVEGLTVQNPEKGVRIAQELFGDAGKRSIKERTVDAPVLGSEEYVQISGDGYVLDVLASISTDAEYTTISMTLGNDIERRSGNVDTGGQKKYKLRYNLGGKRVQTMALIGETGKHGMIIGRRDLQGFLIDPSKKVRRKTHLSSLRLDLRKSDDVLSEVDMSLQMLRNLRPINLLEEVERARKDSLYEPTLLYPELKDPLEDTAMQVRAVETDDSPLGLLLRKKKREVLLKIDLLKSRGDSEKFTAASLALYGSPTSALLSFARQHIEQWRQEKRSGRRMKKAPAITSSEAVRRFSEMLNEYGLHDWSCIEKQSMVSDCAVGGGKVLIRKGAEFSEEHFQALVAHEIEIHVITSENAKVQPYKIFQRGTAGYLDTQEGLAIWNQERVLPPWHEKNVHHAVSVLGVEFALKHRFVDTRRFLHNELGLTPEKALRKALELKRGLKHTGEAGCFTKSLVYFRGYRAVSQFVASGNALAELFIGKIAIEDLPEIAKMSDIKPAILLPRHIQPLNKSKKARKR